MLSADVMLISPLNATLDFILKFVVVLLKPLIGYQLVMPTADLILKKQLEEEIILLLLSSNPKDWAVATLIVISVPSTKG